MAIILFAKVSWLLKLQVPHLDLSVRRILQMQNDVTFVPIFMVGEYNCAVSGLSKPRAAVCNLVAGYGNRALLCVHNLRGNFSHPTNQLADVNSEPVYPDILDFLVISARDA